MSLAERLAHIRRRITEACQRRGRVPESLTLVAVTKTVPVELIKEAIALGVTDIGENRVQEARAKRGELEVWLKAQGSRLKSSFQLPASSFQPVRWHLVGHLQRNKVKDAIELFDVIHSVDSVELVQALERLANLPGPPRASQAGAGQPPRPAEKLSRRGGPASSFQPIEVFIQVNVSGEATKFGCRPEEAETLARAVFECDHLRLAGLMTIPPFSDDPEAARPHFRRLRALRDDLQTTLSSGPLGHSATWPLKLSMGMSHDFEVAIEEGADVVRIGTAIFGAQADRSSEFGVRSSE